MDRGKDILGCRHNESPRRGYRCGSTILWRGGGGGGAGRGGLVSGTSLIAAIGLLEYSLSGLQNLSQGTDPSAHRALLLRRTAFGAVAFITFVALTHAYAVWEGGQAASRVIHAPQVLSKVALYTQQDLDIVDPNVHAFEDVRRESAYRFK